MLDGTGGLYLSHRRELYGHFQNGPVSRSPDGDNKRNAIKCLEVVEQLENTGQR